MRLVECVDRGVSMWLGGGWMRDEGGVHDAGPYVCEAHDYPARVPGCRLILFLHAHIRRPLLLARRRSCAPSWPCTRRPTTTPASRWRAT